MSDTLIIALICLAIGALVVATNYRANRDREYLERKRWNGNPPEIDFEALKNELIQQYVLQDREFEAIKMYQELTGANLPEARYAIHHLATTIQDGEPEEMPSEDKKKTRRVDLEAAPGIRDLLEEGREDEAVDIYQKFAGVDEYTARAMVEKIKREME
jgi:hypothetical protein